MRKSFVTLALLLSAVGLRAECTGPNLSVNADTKSLAVTFKKEDAPALVVGVPVSVAVGETEFNATIKSVKDLVITQIFDLGLPEGAKFEDGVLSLDTGIDTDAGKFTFKENGEEKTVDICLVGFFNTMSQNFDIGPSVAEDNKEEEPNTSRLRTMADDVGNEDNDKPSALRVQYQYSRRRYRPTANSDTNVIPSMRLRMEEFAVSIDTTDTKDKGFVDDNSVMGGFFTPRRTYGNTLNRVRMGIVGQHARGFHGGDHNTDIKVSIDGWVPLLQALNFGTPARRLASPFSFKVSAGNRWQNVDNVASSGGVAEWSFLYHVYLMADYRLDLEHKTVFNDVDKPTASTPRTQHTWKATVLFLGPKGSRFSAVASYENGHSGPVFTQLRQFFVGVGLKNALTGMKK